MFYDRDEPVLPIATVRWALGILCCLLMISGSASAQVTLSVYPSATDTVFGGAVRSLYANVCAGTNAIGCARPSDITTSWSADGGTLSAMTGPYVKWTAPDAPGTYTITASSNGISSTRQFNVIADAVTVNLVPFYIVLYQNQYALLQPIVMGSTNLAVTWSTSGGILNHTPRTADFHASSAGTYTITATSVADPTKSSTMTVVVTANPMPTGATPQHTEPVDCTAVGGGTTYEVYSNADLDALPWKILQPGDTVRIHNNGVPYTRQLILGFTAGTASRPIRLCGVPDASGNLPLLSGNHAQSVTALTAVAYPSAWQPNHVYTVGTKIYDGSAVEKCVTAGTSSSASPQWSSSLNSQTADGSVVWLNLGPPVATDWRSGIQALGVVHVYDAAHIASNIKLSNGYFIIEGLRIGQAIDPTYAGTLGGYQYYPVQTPTTLANYDKAAAALRVQYTHDLVIRGNELFESGNGLFINDQEYVSANTSFVLVEGNNIHNNSSTYYSGTQHDAYLQAVGLVIQGNSIGPPRPGATGNVLPLRAVGIYVRYNALSTVPSTGVVMALGETQNIDWNRSFSVTWTALYGIGNPFTLAQVAANEEAIRSVDYIYGNTFYQPSVRLMQQGSTSMPGLCHDNTLWFYHNSVNIQASAWYVNEFDVGEGCGFDPGSFPYAELHNNAFWIKQGTPLGTAAPYFYWNRYLGDRLNLGKNWIAASWCQSNCGSPSTGGTGVSLRAARSTYQTGNDTGHVTGWTNLVTGNSAPFDLASYAPVSGSPLLSAADALPNSIGDLPANFQYSPATYLMEPRPSAHDLGAIESSSSTQP